MKTTRWGFIAALTLSAMLVGWGSSRAFPIGSMNSPIPTPTPGAIVTPFDSPIPTPKPRPTPRPIVLPPPHRVPFRDEQGDLVIQEEVGLNAHGQLVFVRTKAKPAKKPKNEQANTATATELTHTVFLPIVMKPGLKVLVVAYINNSPSEYPDPDVPADPSVAVDTLTNQLIADLAQGSTWHGYATNNTSALNFSVSSSGVIKLYEMPLYRPDGNFDYVAFYDRFSICSLVQAGLVDEVWVWGNANTRMWESVVNGPTWSMVNGPLPNCGKTVTTFGLNYFRHVSQAMESYTHSIEYFMQRFVPAGYESCDFRTASKPFYYFSTPPECTGQWAVSDTYGFTARAWPENSNTGVCGWAHQPPNQPRAPDYGDPNSMYHYLLTNTVQSRCTDWQWNGGSTTTFNCYTYNCVLPPPGQGDYPYELRSEEKFLIWWMQNIPGLNSNSRGRDGNLRPNWWTVKWK